MWVFLLFATSVLATCGPDAMCTLPSRHSYCIIGAGPAGLQMAYFLKYLQLDFVLFEKEERVGSFFTRFPRNRRLISNNKRFTGNSDKEFNLRHDWNSLLSEGPHSPLLFTAYSSSFFPHADDYARYLNDYANQTDLIPHIRYQTQVLDISGSSPFLYSFPIPTQHRLNVKSSFLQPDGLNLHALPFQETNGSNTMIR